MPRKQFGIDQFAFKIKKRYPGQYDEDGNAELTAKVLARHPQYRSWLSEQAYSQLAPYALERIAKITERSEKQGPQAEGFPDSEKVKNLLWVTGKSLGHEIEDMDQLSQAIKDVNAQVSEANWQQHLARRKATELPPPSPVPVTPELAQPFERFATGQEEAIAREASLAETDFQPSPESYFGKGYSMLSSMLNPRNIPAGLAKLIGGQIQHYSGLAQKVGAEGQEAAIAKENLGMGTARTIQGAFQAASPSVGVLAATSPMTLPHIALFGQLHELTRSYLADKEMNPGTKEALGEILPLVGSLGIGRAIQQTLQAGGDVKQLIKEHQVKVRTQQATAPASTPQIPEPKLTKRQAIIEGLQKQAKQRAQQVAATPPLPEPPKEIPAAKATKGPQPFTGPLPKVVDIVPERVKPFTPSVLRPKAEVQPIPKGAERRAVPAEAVAVAETGEQARLAEAQARVKDYETRRPALQQSRKGLKYKLFQAVADLSSAGAAKFDKLQKDIDTQDRVFVKDTLQYLRDLRTVGRDAEASNLATALEQRSQGMDKLASLIETANEKDVRAQELRQKLSTTFDPVERRRLHLELGDQMRQGVWRYGYATAEKLAESQGILLAEILKAEALGQDATAAKLKTFLANQPAAPKGGPTGPRMSAETLDYVDKLTNPIEKTYAQELARASFTGDTIQAPVSLDPLRAETIRTELTATFKAEPPKGQGKKAKRKAMWGLVWEGEDLSFAGKAAPLDASGRFMANAFDGGWTVANQQALLQKLGIVKQGKQPRKAPVPEMAQLNQDRVTTSAMPTEVLRETPLRAEVITPNLERKLSREQMTQFAKWARTRAQASRWIAAKYRGEKVGAAAPKPEPQAEAPLPKQLTPAEQPQPTPGAQTSAPVAPTAPPELSGFKFEAEKPSAKFPGQTVKMYTRENPDLSTDTIAIYSNGDWRTMKQDRFGNLLEAVRPIDPSELTKPAVAQPLPKVTKKSKAAAPTTLTALPKVLEEPAVATPTPAAKTAPKVVERRAPSTLAEDVERLKAKEAAKTVRPIPSKPAAQALPTVIEEPAPAQRVLEQVRQAEAQATTVDPFATREAAALKGLQEAQAALGKATSRKAETYLQTVVSKWMAELDAIKRAREQRTAPLPQPKESVKNAEERFNAAMEEIVDEDAAVEGRHPAFLPKVRSSFEDLTPKTPEEATMVRELSAITRDKELDKLGKTGRDLLLDAAIALPNSIPRIDRWERAVTALTIYKKGLKQNDLSAFDRAMKYIKRGLENFHRGEEGALYLNIPQPTIGHPKLERIRKTQQSERNPSFMERFTNWATNFHRGYLDQFLFINDRADVISRELQPALIRELPQRIGGRVPVERSIYVAARIAQGGAGGMAEVGVKLLGGLYASAKRVGLGDALVDWMNAQGAKREWQVIETKLARARQRRLQLEQQIQGIEATIRSGQLSIRKGARALQPFQNELTEAKAEIKSYVNSIRANEVAPIGMTRADIARIENQYANRFTPEQMQKIRAWETEYEQITQVVLQDLHSAGIVSDAFLRTVEPYGPYIPMQRILDHAQEVKASKFGSSAMELRVDRVVRQMGGSARTNRNPFDAALAFWQEAYKEIVRNGVAKEVVTQWPAIDPQGFGQEIKPVRLDHKPRAGYGVISVFEGGRPKHFEVPEFVALTLKQVGLLETSTASKTLRVFASLFRAGTTIANPGFFMPNVIRDLEESAVLAKGIRGPLYFAVKFMPIWLKALRERLQEGPEYLESLRAGVQFSTLQRHITPEKFTQEYRDPLGSFSRLSTDIRETLQNPLRVPKKAYNIVVDFGSALEEATKMAHYKNLRQLGLTEKEAAWEARNYGGSPDFGHRGYASGNANLMFMYLMANINAVRRVFTRFMEDPKKLSTVFAASSALAMALQAHNRGALMPDQSPAWSRVPQFDRDNNFIVIQKDQFEKTTQGAVVPKYYKIPKPLAYRLAYNPIEQVINQYLDDTFDPKAVALDVVNTVAPGQFALREGRVVEGVGYGVIGSANPLLRVPVEQITGGGGAVSFQEGMPIEPKRLQDLEAQFAHDPSTSVTARKFTELTRRASDLVIGREEGDRKTAIEKLPVLGKLLTRPKFAESAARGIFGGLGEIALSVSDRLLGQTREGIKPVGHEALRHTPIAGPIIRRFVTTPQDNLEKETERKFYNMAENFRTANRTFNALIKRDPEQAQAYFEENQAIIGVAKAVAKIEREVAESRAIQQFIAQAKDVSDQEKWDIAHELYNARMEQMQGMNAVMEESINVMKAELEAKRGR